MRQLVEIQVVQAVRPEDKAQLLSQIRLLDVSIGLRFRFHAAVPAREMSRFVPPAAPSNE